MLKVQWNFSLLKRIFFPGVVVWPFSVLFVICIIFKKILLPVCSQQHWARQWLQRSTMVLNLQIMSRIYKRKSEQNNSFTLISSLPWHLCGRTIVRHCFLNPVPGVAQTCSCDILKPPEVGPMPKWKCFLKQYRKERVVTHDAFKRKYIDVIVDVIFNCPK